MVGAATPSPSCRWSACRSSSWRASGSRMKSASRVMARSPA